MAEPHDRKPILTIEQQIEHLKQKGVAFELCSEEEAADYLRDKCNFFKLASYRKLFSKYEGGPRDGRYVDLDFGQLRLLAALDQELRHALLGMTLDIEHFQKATLLRREGRRPGLGVQRRLPKGRRRGNSQGDQEEVDGEYGHAGGRDRARGALRLGTRGLLALARRIRARRDVRQGRRRNRGAARQGARRRSSLRARVPSQVDRIARVGRIACR